MLHTLAKYQIFFFSRDGNPSELASQQALLAQRIEGYVLLD